MRTWSLQDAKNRFSEVVKRAQAEGPQQVTMRGEPCVVVIDEKEYRQLTKQRRNIADALAMPEGIADLEFEPPRVDIEVRPADLS